MLEFVRLFFFICLVLACAACSDPKLQPLPSDGVILAFGDSLTAGYGVSKEDSYPAVLSRLVNRSVVNAGVSGETTSEGLKRIEGVLDREQPDLLILIEGGNDILRNQNLDTTENNLNFMIEAAKKRNIDVVLMGIPLKSLFSTECAPLYQSLADKHHVPLDCDSIGKLLRKNQYKSDAIHFNKAGYALMAKRVMALLEKEGAL